MTGKEIKGHYSNGNERERKGKWTTLINHSSRSAPFMCNPFINDMFNALPSKMSVVPDMSQELPVHGQLRVKKTHVYRRFWYFWVKMACTFSFHDLFHKSQHVWSQFLWYTRRCRVWEERWHLFYVFNFQLIFDPKPVFYWWSLRPRLAVVARDQNVFVHVCFVWFINVWANACFKLLCGGSLAFTYRPSAEIWNNATCWIKNCH